MEKELAEIVTALLMGDPDFTAVMGDRLFPLIADEGTQTPYAVYRVDQEESISKDDARRYYVTVALVYPPKGYLAAVELKGKVQALFTGSRYAFSQLPSPTDYDHDTYSVVAIANFEIINS